MLNKANRLKKRKEFNYIYKKGQLAHSANFTVHYVRAFKPYAQIGISVSKNVGNSVVRSRVKRIISEACRPNIDKFAIKNYIITAKPSIVDKKSTELETELLTLLKKNGLIKTDTSKPQIDSNIQIYSNQQTNSNQRTDSNQQTEKTNKTKILAKKNVLTNNVENAEPKNVETTKATKERLKVKTDAEKAEKAKTKASKIVAGKGKKDV